MNKSISVALLVTLVCTACIPGFAQKGRSNKELVKPVRTAFARVAPITDGNGVLVQWQMTVERRNVGFFVDRVGAFDSGRVNASMILGSSARSSEEISYGGRYQVFDPQGTKDTQYVVRSIGREGNEITSKVGSVLSVKDLEAVTGASSASWLETVNPVNKNITGGDLDMHPELRQLVQESLQTPDLPTHRWVVAQPGVKIAVRKEGMYRVTAGELAAAGFNTEMGSDTWRLFAEGVEQAITVAPGNGYIEFYGKPIDTVESDTRIYYLINDTNLGKRIGTKVLRSIGGPSFSANYPVTTVKKERNSYVNTIHNGDAGNYWGTVVSSFPYVFPFTLTGVETTGNVTFTTRLQGYSPAGHVVRVVLNGVEIQTVSWQGFDAGVGTVTIPANRLVEGTNSLQMTGTVPGEFSLFDSISIQHNRRYEAEQNKVGFFTPGYRKVDVTGFTSANVRVFDTTLDGNPKHIVGLPVVQNGSTFKVTLPSSRDIVAYAIEDSAMLASPSVGANNPSNYSSSTQPYDFIIISHGSSDFMTASQSWANYRGSQGFTTKVVDIADIYDEFSYGSVSSESIKSFLNYAYTDWTQDPKYVMLMGDSTHDPRNYEGHGYWDLVPSKNVDLVFEETASDEALADFNGDTLSEFAIGRIPARNVAFINTAYGKTVSFETAPNQSLDRGALFAYDQPVGYDFFAMSIELENQLAPTMPKRFIGRGTPNARPDLLSELSLGKYIANYSGHGSLGLWGGPDFFASSDVLSLTNANNPTFFTMLTCLNGYFIVPSPNFDSISEHLIKSNTGGAVATWSSTARTTADVQQMMALRFYSQLGQGQIQRVGDLIMDAKTQAPGGDVRFSWVLLGDPMLKMR